MCRQSQIEHPPTFAGHWCFSGNITYWHRHQSEPLAATGRRISRYNRLRSDGSEVGGDIPMPVDDARTRRRGACPPRRDCRGAQANRAGRGRHRFGAGDAALRKRRAHRLSGASDGGRAAGDDRAGVRRARLLPPRRHQGGAARGRDLAVGRRAAARRRRSSRHGQIQSHPRHRFRQPRRRGRARRHQSCGLAGGAKAPASITRPIRRRRSPAPSAATSRKIPAACIA